MLAGPSPGQELAGRVKNVLRIQVATRGRTARTGDRSFQCRARQEAFIAFCDVCTPGYWLDGKFLPGMAS